MFFNVPPDIEMIFRHPIPAVVIEVLFVTTTKSVFDVEINMLRFVNAIRIKTELSQCFPQVAVSDLSDPLDSIRSRIRTQLLQRPHHVKTFQALYPNSTVVAEDVSKWLGALVR